jgi:hypothetical protein
MYYEYLNLLISVNISVINLSEFSSIIIPMSILIYLMII